MPTNCSAHCTTASPPPLRFHRSMCMLAPIDSGVTGMDPPGVDDVGRLHRGRVDDEGAISSNRRSRRPGRSRRSLAAAVTSTAVNAGSTQRQRSAKRPPASPLLTLRQSNGRGHPDRHGHRPRNAPRSPCSTRGMLQRTGRSTGSGPGRNACRDSKPQEAKLQIGRVIGLYFLGAVAHGLDDGRPMLRRSGAPERDSARECPARAPAL